MNACFELSPLSQITDCEGSGQEQLILIQARERHSWSQSEARGKEDIAAFLGRLQGDRKKLLVGLIAFESSG